MKTNVLCAAAESPLAASEFNCTDDLDLTSRNLPTNSSESMGIALTLVHGFGSLGPSWRNHRVLLNLATVESIRHKHV